MINSNLNILTFLLTTLFYYLSLKPKLSYDDMTNPEKYKNYLGNNKLYLAVYFFLILLVQFIVNAYMITQTCGGSVTQNMGASGRLALIPWSLIFGAIIAVLVIYPGFKSAFSDVIGYYYVSSSANKLLVELLVNTHANDELNEESTNSNNPIKSDQSGGTAATKKQLEEAADMIVKICGNASLLINQIVPSNFVDFWNMLKPLMKPQYQNEGAEAQEKRNALFELVVTRDNVGEAMWYIYTGLLISCIVQMKISSRGCTIDPDQMAKNYQNYVAEQAAVKKQEKQATSTVYTMTN
jgi:hypothetical protein